MPARTKKAAATPTLPPTNLERIYAAETAKQRKAPKTAYQKLTAAQEKKQLEAEFRQSLVGIPIPPAQEQKRIITGTRYRADFLWEDVRLVIEIDGSMWGRRNTQTGEWEQGKPGAHVSGRGYTHDRHRDARCFLAGGWITFRFTAEMVRDGSAAYYTEQLYKMLAARREQGVA